MNVPGAAWRLTVDGQRLFEDDEEHVRLLLRTLVIDEPQLRRVLERYGERCRPGPLDDHQRLEALAAAYAENAPHAVSVPPRMPARACPACGDPAARLRPSMARRNAAPDRAPLVYGVCPRCGHGCLMSEAAAPTVYGGAGYFKGGDARGVGYRDYAGERAYREGKGHALLAWIGQALGRRPRSVLEVGSGYGFVRKAFQDQGVSTHGVDLNPHAEAQARRLYDMATTVGTLATALADRRDPVVRCGPWDVVLHHFVLEHLVDPVAELRHAASALAPDGAVALVVPSMEATERHVFGASYRSLRADHLHLFSRASIGRCLAQAGLVESAFKSDCALHLLRGFVGAAGVAEIYRSGRGPDLFVVARLNG